MYEHELDTPLRQNEIERLVGKVERDGEIVELIRGGTTVAVIIGIDAYDELVAGTS